MRKWLTKWVSQKWEREKVRKWESEKVREWESKRVGAREWESEEVREFEKMSRNRESEKVRK